MWSTASIPIICIVIGTSGLDPNNQDQRFFQGAWKVVSTRTGNKDTEDYLSEYVLQIKGSSYRWYRRGLPEGSGTFKVGTHYEPKQIDFYGDRSKTRKVGIYKMEGLRLTMCWTVTPGMSRPSHFEIEGIDMQILVVLERNTESEKNIGAPPERRESK